MYNLTMLRTMWLLFCKQTYSDKIQTGVALNASLAVHEFAQFGRWPKFNEQGFPSAHLEELHQVNALAAIGNGKPRCYNHTGPMSPLIRIWDLCVRAWFWVFKYIAVDLLLGTSFIDRGTRKIIQTKLKFVTRHSGPVGLSTTKLVIILINAGDASSIMITNLRIEARSN